LKEVHIEQDLGKALKGAEAVIFAVRHEAYLNLDPDELVKTIGQPAAIIDCFGVLSDDNIRRYFQLGCEVKGLGRGHIQRIKDEVRKA
jgi:UDP-N-acetyl-D-mannosaminuronate dehydrogenase